MNIRFLEADEYYKLEHLFKQHGDSLPNPNRSRIAVAEEEGEIVGFISFNLMPICSMWIHQDYRHNGLWQALVEQIQPLSEVERTYIEAATPETEAICEKLGLRKLNFPVYVKDI